MLINAYRDNDESMRIALDDLVDECKTLYFAGQETTAMLLSWAAFLLSIHTDWQEKAKYEVINIFGHQTPTPDGLTKLKIMSMIINETLRLYPPISGLPRKIERAVKLGNLTLPGNIDLQFSTLALHTFSFPRDSLEAWPKLLAITQLHTYLSVWDLEIV